MKVTDLVAFLFYDKNNYDMKFPFLTYKNSLA